MTQTRPRRRPLTHQEKLALQERKQRRREKMEESRELAKGPIDLTFCLLVMLLMAIGLVILLSASFPFAYYKENPSRHNPLYYFERQAVFAVLGTAVMLLVSKFNYQRLRGAGRALIYVSVIFLILVIIPHNPIAVTAKGATRWLKIGVQFQPSEIAKVAIITYFADSISRKKDKMRSFRYGVLPLRLYSGGSGRPGGR
ncbi:MAG: FtsW/RodA/SpoVE family cell cycle protein [Dysosmobacter sp.]